MDIPLNTDQLNKNRRHRWYRWVTYLVLVAIVLLLVGYSLSNSVNRSDIRTAKVKHKTLNRGLSAGGVIVPLVEETIASNITSQVKRVILHAGERVTKGQVIMQLDSSKLQLEIDNMNEEIALKQNKMTSRQLNLNRNVNELRGQIELLEVDLDSRRTKLARLTQLAKSGVTSLTDLKEASLNVKRTEIEIRQHKRKIEDSSATTLSEIKGLQLEKSILEKSRAEKIRVLQSTTVKATRDGLIVWVKSEEGAAVVTGEALVRIADTQEFKLRVTISDFYLNQLWQGMPAEFNYDGVQFHGSLQSFIASEQEGILAITITLSENEREKQTKLRQKQRVDVTLITEVIENASVLAKGPFINGPGVQQVFVIADGLATRKEVTIGSGNRQFYQVKQGLKVGDEVIISDVTNIAGLSQVNIN